MRVKPIIRHYLPITAALIIVIIIGSYYYWKSYYSTYTNDAYVTTDIVSIASEVSGTIMAVPVHNNEFVKKGQLLAVIDPTQYAYQVKLAQAKLQQAINEKNALTATLQSKYAIIKASQAKLKQAAQYLAEIQPLQQHSYASLKQLHDAQAQIKTLRAQLEENTADLQVVKAKIGTLDTPFAAISIAKQNLALAKLNLRHTRIRAPQDGYITNLLLYKGEFVTPGKHTLTFINNNTWRTVANYRETAIHKIHIGDPAIIHLTMYPDKVFSGTISSIGWGSQRIASNPLDTLLPNINPQQSWGKLPQRFPVYIKMKTPGQKYPLRVGSLATVTVH